MGGTIGNYPNGHVPVEYLIHVSGNTYLPPGTYMRWLWMREQAVARYGVTLRITSQYSTAWNAWNGYRPFAAQRMYRDAYGNMAAVPGTSSHGGTWNGREAFAIDVENWMDLSWSQFSGLAHEAGFTTNFVTPTEKWHIGDFNNPWAVPDFAGGGNVVPPPTPDNEDEDEMYSVKMNNIQYGLGKEFITYYGDSRQRKLGKEITGNNILHDFGNGDGASEPFQNFMALFDALGIPRTAINGQGLILNPENGNYEFNGTWSRSREILAALE